MLYRGRFAPSPSGPLHAGSLVAALASWLDARAHGGRWLVRMEDVDTPRCVPGAAEQILLQLAACGLRSDEPVRVQSQRGGAYQAAGAQLLAAGQAFRCACTRKAIDEAWLARGVVHQRFAERIYPGTCRQGLNGDNGDTGANGVNAKMARTLRFRAQGLVHWHDRRLGPQQQDVEAQVGDFVLQRADGLWAYQLAVVVDDAAQGITHVVRGQDLADNTARQILLQQALGVALPSYLHTPLVLAPDGHKLSKQNGAQPLNLSDPVAALAAAGAVLGLPTLPANTVSEWLAAAPAAWAGIIRAFTRTGEPLDDDPAIR